MSPELQIVGRWCALVRARSHEIGSSLQAETGEEFTTCGDLALDHDVAEILLETRHKALPNYGWNNEDSTNTAVRPKRSVRGQNIQLLPVLLFEIDWALTAPSVSWPEAYLVTYIPFENLRILTASRDDDSIWGYADLAIGMCNAVRGPEFGAKKILQSWWLRAHGECPQIWEAFTKAGLIDERRALRWGMEVLAPQEGTAW